MNLPRICLIGALLMALGANANGQGAPKAVLVDEHPNLPCDDSLSRLDAYFNELSRSPPSVGLVVISSARQEVDDAPVFVEFLKGNPHAPASIVVRDRSIGMARRKATRIRRQFQTRYGISPSRLRFFPRSSTNLSDNREAIVEYWYLP